MVIGGSSSANSSTSTTDSASGYTSGTSVKLCSKASKCYQAVVV
jgi:hypothetical protein